MEISDIRFTPIVDTARPFIRAAFVATILTGSFLLFLVQPMVARMALPRLGGAPAVWNSAMLVYQALLLGGYAYAHALGRLPLARQAAVHLVLMVMAACWLPIGLARMQPPAGITPALWVPWLLAVSIGPLFFVVAAQAPSMQRWFALRSPNSNPYALYAASNLGSFGGLLAYPLIVEPSLTVAHQSLLWTIGYAGLFVLVLACAATARKADMAPDVMKAVKHLVRPIPARQWVRWIMLAAVPSGLMLSTTTHLTTDIVAMPLIWVVPLGLYLLSFSIAFSGRQGLSAQLARTFPPVLVIGAISAFSSAIFYPVASAAMSLLLLLVVAVALHGEMYRTRPDAIHLTRFYLAMSIGGVIGGLFCALLAPIAFDWAYEHPLLILAAAAMLPQPAIFPRLSRLLDKPVSGPRLVRWLALGLTLLTLAAGGFLIGDLPLAARVVIVCLLAGTAFVVVDRRGLFAAAIVAVMLSGGGWLTLLQSAVPGMRVRSYYGIYTISNQPNHTRILIHGTTTHGVQRTQPGHEREPTSYYAPLSGVGLAMNAVPSLFGAQARIGVVGLGAGTLACYARPGQRWSFYEIDPAVVAIARNPRLFTFLSRCAPDVPVTLGDARLSLARPGGHPMDMLVIDAFSSDAVPVHLLTREAFAIYLARLKPAGLLLVHISNRFFDLEPVLAAATRGGGMVAAVRDYNPDTTAMKAGATSSVWVALSRNPGAVARLTTRQGENWRPLRATPGFTPWTDDYASVLGVLRRN